MTGWDIPMTEDFVAAVHRGIRRRRRWRLAAAGAAVVAVLGGAFFMTAPSAPPPAAPVIASSPPLDGIRIGMLPPGAAVVGQDSSSLMAVTADGLTHDTPSAGDATAVVTARRFDRGVGIGFWVTVLRPLAGDPAETHRWIEDWSTSKTDPVETFSTPVGEAGVYLGISKGATIVISTWDNAVVTIGGNAAFSRVEMTDVAKGLERV